MRSPVAWRTGRSRAPRDGPRRAGSPCRACGAGSATLEHQNEPLAGVGRALDTLLRPESVGGDVDVLPPGSGRVDIDDRAVRGWRGRAVEETPRGPWSIAAHC